MKKTALVGLVVLLFLSGCKIGQGSIEGIQIYQGNLGIH